MNRFLSIFISIVGMILVVIFSMNSILYVTHPSLSYGTEGMFHVSILFMLFSLGTLYFLSRLNVRYFEKSTDIDQPIFNMLFKNDIVVLNLTSITILNLYFVINQIETSISILFVFMIEILLIICWILFILWLHTKKERSIEVMLPIYTINITFTAFTVYLFIELFLYFNLN